MSFQVKPSCSNSLTKVAANGSIKTQSATQNQSCSFVKIHSQEGYMKNVPEFKESLDTKVHFVLNIYFNFNGYTIRWLDISCLCF